MFMYQIHYKNIVFAFYGKYVFGFGFDFDCIRTKQ